MNVFILTRFNIDIRWNTKIIDHVPARTEEWLEERFRLFDKYTYPSVRALHHKEFHWICLFADDTPERFRGRIDTYVQEEPRLDACFVDAEQAMNLAAVFRNRIRKLTDAEDEGLLTIYLDSDDCLRNDFVDKLTSYAQFSSYGTVFSFKYGIQYYEQMNIAVRIPYPNNHFLAYYESLGERIKTIWSFSHFEIFKYKGIQIHTEEDCGQPMWIEVIHGGNVDNDVKMTLGHRLIGKRDFLYAFGLPLELGSRWRSAFIFVTSFQRRFLMQVVRRTRNKIRQLYS